jgi:ribonuclease-3
MALYKRAFTHGSADGPDYQRLEFLGDRVLGLIIAQQLFELYPDEPEGKLSQRLNMLVSGTACAAVLSRLGGSAYIRLGKQARDDGARQSPHIQGDVMEALIGAIYCQSGLDSARDFVLRHWSDHIAALQDDVRHPKSILQEWAAANKRKSPIYELIERTGPDHALQFRVRVTVANVGSAEASAPSKQAAETAAAARFLEQYR